MKNKILSIALALSMILSLSVVPTFAMTVDEFDETYAEKRIDNNFDDETAEGAPDGSAGFKQITADTSLWAGDYYTSEFLASLDFRFDADTATMTVKNNKSDVGPILSYNEGKLRTQTGGSSWKELGSIELNKWYSMEIQGKLKSAGANAVFRLYSWENGTKSLINTVENLNLRNFSSGSTKNNPIQLLITAGLSVDNEFFASLYPDEVTVVPAVDGVTEINGGQSLQMTAAATIEDKACTVPTFTWELYDEAGTAALRDDNISIDANGLVSTLNKVTTQTITIRATSDTKSTPYGEYKLKINEVDTSGDKYDKLVLSADKDYVRVNEPLTINATATMNDEAIELTEEDVVWSIYNAANIAEVKNSGITIENGVLTVTEAVVAQDIVVKAQNPSGTIITEYNVHIRPANMNITDENIYTDTYASSDACEEVPTGEGASNVTLTEGSWDGSSYYVTSGDYHFVGFSSETTENVIYSADVKFTGENSGFEITNKDKKVGMQLQRQGTKLGALGSSSKFNPYIDIDAESWYNVQLMCATGNGGESYATLILYKYDADGNKVNPSDATSLVPFVQTGVQLRNLAERAGRYIKAYAGTCVDNVQAIYVSPNEFEIALDVQTALAGSSVQATVTASRNGVQIPLIDKEKIKYVIYDSNNQYPLEDEKITINADGKIEIDSMASAQDVYVRVESVSGDFKDSVKLTIKSSDIFEIVGIGFNKDYTKVVELDVNKAFAYDKEVTFVIVAYDENKLLKSVKVRSTYGDEIPEGESSVKVDCELEGFDKDKDTLKVYTWTKLK